MAHNNNLEIIPTASSLLNEINQLFDSSSSESQTDDDSEDGDQGIHLYYSTQFLECSLAHVICIR